MVQRVLLLLGFVCWSLSEVAPELDLRPRGMERTEARDYIAAVYEFASQRWDLKHPEPWRTNLDTVRQQAETAARQGADILVFAEYGITSTSPLVDRAAFRRFSAEVPDPELEAVLCGNQSSHQVLETLSCLAAENRMYIVANYGEKEPCSPQQKPRCPDDGWRLFNTNLVFDRRGALIQRYRKHHLFGIELKVLQTPELHLAAFRTDFGVDIGTFTCFDILFEYPAVELTRRGISTIAFPTDWGDELPSLTALQMHSAWARGLGVTVLSSGFHRPERGNIGSGIYTAEGFLNYTYDFTSTSGVLVTAEVSISGQRAAGASNKRVETCTADRSCSALGSEQGDICDMKEAGEMFEVSYDPRTDYYPIQNYNVSDFVSTTLTGKTQQLCSNGFCCTLSITAPNTETLDEKRPISASAQSKGEVRDQSTAVYRLLAYSGHRNFAPHWSTEICAVVLCRNASQASCSYFPSTSVQRIPPFTLSGTFGDKSTVFPSAITTELTFVDQWDYSRSSKQLTVTETSQLFVAQLYGRDYKRDLP